VSVRTVEGHIYQPCRKLGVVNRTELARVLAEFTPGDATGPGWP
jgi:DNA-binding CsgD family transcriptional regulator